MNVNINANEYFLFSGIQMLVIVIKVFVLQHRYVDTFKKWYVGRMQCILLGTGTKKFFQAGWLINQDVEGNTLQQ